LKIHHYKNINYISITDLCHFILLIPSVSLPHGNNVHNANRKFNHRTFLFIFLYLGK